MPINSWYMGCAVVLASQVFFLKGFELLEPGNTVVHVLLYAALALLLWIAADGRRPVALIGGVMLLAAFDAADAAHFLADALAAIATGATLTYLTGKKTPCAESSPR